MSVFTPSEHSLISPGLHRLPIEGLYFIEHHPHSDDRGFYAELSRIPEIEAVTGESFVIKQLNLSHSKNHVIRGFHGENWNKLLSILTGSALCAWVDIRPESSTFGQVVTMQVGLGEGAHFGSVFVSAGLANAFCVTEGPLNYLYGVDQLYAKRDTSGDVALSLFDTDLAVEWPITRDEMVISERDLNAKSLRELFPNKFKNV